MVKRKLALALAFLLVYAPLTPSNYSYASEEKIPGVLTATKVYDSSDNVTDETTDTNYSGSANPVSLKKNVSLSSTFKLEFKDTNGNSSLKTDLSDASDLVDVYEATDQSKNDISTAKFIETKDNFTGLDITIAPKKLSPDSSYVVDVDLSEVTLVNGDTITGKSMTFTFSTEKQPTITGVTSDNSGNIVISLSRKAAKLETDVDSNNIKFVDLTKNDVDKKISEILKDGAKASDSVKLDNGKKTITIKKVKPSKYTVKINNKTSPPTLKRAMANENSSLPFKEFKGSVFTVQRPANFFKANIEFETIDDEAKVTKYVSHQYDEQNTSIPKITGVYLDTNFTINLNTIVKAKQDKELSDIISMTKEKSPITLGDYYEVSVSKKGASSTVTNGFDTIHLKKLKPLEPGKLYGIKVSNNNLMDEKYSEDVGSGNFLFGLEAEKAPTVTQGALVNKNYVAKFDRHIEPIKVTDIELFSRDDFGKFQVYPLKQENLVTSGNMLTINSLENGRYKIQFNTKDKLKVRRKQAKDGETHLYTDKFIGANEDESRDDFEIKKLSTEVAKSVLVERYNSGKMENLNIKSETSESTKANQVSVDTEFRVAYTIPYVIIPTNPNDAFKISPVTNTTQDAIFIKAPVEINKNADGAIESVGLTLEKPLSPETTYMLQIMKDKFKNSNGETPGEKGEIEKYYFITESYPKPVVSEKPIIYKKEADQVITIPFDKNIELVDKSKITIDSKITPMEVNVVEDKLTVKISAKDAKDLTIADHTINIAQGAIKRRGSDDLFAKDEIVVFAVQKSPEEIQKEEEDKKKEEADKKKEEADQQAQKEKRDYFRSSVAKALIAEMEKRYQAEYGSDSTFKTFDDYMKDRYGKGANDKSYMQEYLEDRGYIDDFISKYGYDTEDVKAAAVDYMNRYGSFAYRNDRKYDNPFFKDPFNSPSSKRGYYDYYNYYDYGYRFPVMRQGDDSISTANLEKAQQLKDKEQELLDIKKGYQYYNNFTYRPTSANSPHIVINTYSRYFTYEDQFSNKNQADMGVTPVVRGGRTFVAIAPIADLTGAWITYDDSTKTITLSRPGKVSALTVNSSYITLNGKPENMGIRPIIVNGKFMVPTHYLAKALGLEESQVTFSSGQIVIQR